MTVFEDVERSVEPGHYNSEISVLRLFRFEGFGRIVGEGRIGAAAATSQYWRG